MKSLIRYLMGFFRKLRELYHADEELQYRLHVGDCYYSDEKQEYIAVLHTTGKRGSFKMSVREIVADRGLIAQIHPIQASSLGWMAREAHYKFAANDSRYHTKIAQ